MQSTNIYKVKPILCFVVKKCANWLQTARTANGGGVVWQHACAMQTNMVPPQLFLHCCAYDTVSSTAGKSRDASRSKR